jgi:acetyl esterase
MKALKLLALVVLLIVLGTGLLVYSWTYTPHGRLDAMAAIFARISAMNDEPLAFDLSSIDRQRRAANEQMGTLLRMAPVSDGVAISNRTIPGPGPGGGIRLREYRPEGVDNPPVLLWIHGGGFWMGNQLEDWDGTVSVIAAGAGVAVFSVDYRLAPEHPWPAAVDDSYAALLWVHDNAAELGVDGKRIAVGGGSAGGNLAAVVALKARDEDGPAIAAQLLFVPATDASDTVYPSDELFAEGYILTSPNVQTMLEAYLPNPGDRLHPFASPLLADSHADLPPALVMTAQFDPLRDEGEAYGEKLRAAGVPVEVIRYDGAVHGLVGSFDSIRDSHRAQVSLLRQAFQ